MEQTQKKNTMEDLFQEVIELVILKAMLKHLESKRKCGGTWDGKETDSNKD